MSEEMSHPDPIRWWWHRRVQSYIGILGLIAIAVLVTAWGVSDGAGSVLEYVAIGCVLLVVGYGPGNTLCDAIRAWRGS